STSCVQQVPARSWRYNECWLNLPMHGASETTMRSRSWPLQHWRYNTGYSIPQFVTGPSLPSSRAPPWGHGRSQTPLVFDALRTMRVVPAGDLANQASGVFGEAGNGFGGEATRQEPEEVPATALDGILGPAVTSTQFIWAEVGFEMDGSR